MSLMVIGDTAVVCLFNTKFTHLVLHGDGFYNQTSLGVVFSLSACQQLVHCTAQHHIIVKVCRSETRLLPQDPHIRRAEAYGM